MNDAELDVVLVNRTLGIAVLTDNSTVPVTHWFNPQALPCSPDEAVTCVAGSEAVGWFAVDLEQFQYAKVH